jgi:F-type H+-transporting ATPase subunit b
VIELSPHLIAIVVVLVLILMWVLNLMLYRPMLKGLDDRKEIVEGAARDAENAEQNIEKLQLEYDHALQDARKEAKAVFNQNQEEGLNKEKEILTEAQQKSEKFMEKAMNDLNKSTDSAKDQLKSYIETLSREISSKILGRAF